MGQDEDMKMKTTLMFLALAALVSMPGAAEAKRYSLALNFGQDVLVTGKDDAGIRAQCIQNEGGNDVVRVYAVTANDAVFRGALNGYYGDGFYLTAVTPAPSAVVTVLAYATGTSLVYSQSDAGTMLNLTTMHG